MKKMSRSPHLLIESRFFAASIVIVIAALILWLRLWQLQIYRGDYYRRISENNRVRKIDVPAPRGILYDAWGKIILGNTATSELIVVPQYMKNQEKTFDVLARLLHQPGDLFKRKYKRAKSLPKFMPITMMRNLSLHEVSIIESNRLFLPGVEVRTTARREYNTGTSPHTLGHLGELSPSAMEEFNAKNKNNPYSIGDLVGRSGLEARLEQYLRGQHGYTLIQVDAFGRASNPTEHEWDLPLEAAKPGSNVQLTIDLELQETVSKAFSGKNGAVVVMDPNTGGILALTSLPSWDPYMYQRGLSPEEFRAMTLDPLHPFMDKTTSGEFAPGSTYKALVALAALQDGIITPNRSYICNGSFSLGSQAFGCWKKGGHGTVSLHRALMQSCDVYFYHVGIELGVDRIAKYARDFGLGSKLGLEINMERPGLVPTQEWKKATHKELWAAGETPSVAIGQGYNLMTPLQLAALYSAIATRGKVWKPYIVKRISTPAGITLDERTPTLVRTIDSVSLENFELVRSGLEAVVMDDEGTGKNARVPGVRVAGKTGSVQVVNLKKNKNQSDVSILWKEHALFASFAPVENPEVVVVIISEHDDKGGGGASAAPVAGQILRSYFDLKKRRAGLAIGAAVTPIPTSQEGAEHD